MTSHETGACHHLETEVFLAKSSKIILQLTWRLYCLWDHSDVTAHENWIFETTNKGVREECKSSLKYVIIVYRWPVSSCRCGQVITYSQYLQIRLHGYSFHLCIYIPKLLWAERYVEYLYICLVQVRLRAEVLRTPSSTQLGFEHDLQIMTIFHVTETPAQTTRPSVTLACIALYNYKGTKINDLSS